MTDDRLRRALTQTSELSTTLAWVERAVNLSMSKGVFDMLEASTSSA
jgi:hypothetical protein